MIYAFFCATYTKNKVHATYIQKKVNPIYAKKNECRLPFSILRGLCGHFESSLLQGRRDSTGHVAILPTLRPPGRQGYALPFDFVPTMGTPKRRVNVAILPTCGPLRWHKLCSPPLILSKHWGPPRRHGLCSHFAHTSAPKMVGFMQPLFILSPHWGPPRWQGSCSYFTHTLGPKTAGVM